MELSLHILMVSFQSLFTIGVIWMLTIPIFYHVLGMALVHGRIQLDKDVFQSLVNSETNVKIFWTQTRWKDNVYFANVDGNQVYTTSALRMEFPDSCELISTKPTKIL